MYLFLTPSKTDGRVPSQQGAPTTCNLSYREVSQQKCVQTLLASLGVVIGQNSAPHWGWGGGGEGGLRAKFTPTVGGEGKEASENRKQQLFQMPNLESPLIIIRSSQLRHPEWSISQQLFPFKDILFFQISQPAKNLSEEKIF